MEAKPQRHLTRKYSDTYPLLFIEIRHTVYSHIAHRQTTKLDCKIYMNCLRATYFRLVLLQFHQCCQVRLAKNVKLLEHTQEVTY